MKKFLDRLKQKWGVKNNWHFFIICLVFALTGMTAVQMRKIVFPLLGVNEATPFWQVFIIWMLVIFPCYYIFLLFYGFIFGQFTFFYGMVKKTFGRFRRAKQKAPNN